MYINLATPLAEMSAFFDQPSLASATNTRVDSACKHIQQCRVSTDDMLKYAGDDVDEVRKNKYRYCIHKDELVLGIGRPWNPSMTRKRTNNAYPRVISSLGHAMVEGDNKLFSEMLKYIAHYARSVQEKKAIIDWFKSERYHPPPAGLPDAFEADALRHTKDHLPWLVDYTPVGYANTIGWAHADTGDTVLSVMIGGLRTVMNGDFEIFAGDIVQWYWPFERDCFDKEGNRLGYHDEWTPGGAGGWLPPNVKPGTLTWGLDKRETSREDYHKLQFGQQGSKKDKVVARIKPYFRDDEHPRLYDGYRVFAVAISSARPHEMVDIKIARQSL